ncbi:MAG: hypothetical protein J7L34_02065 [Thermotogaceae bacterium]|nr:hypothetical protein [Thermotogaceae bacterium]
MYVMDYLPEMEFPKEVKTFFKKRRRNQLVDDISKLEKKRKTPISGEVYLVSSLSIFGAASYIGYKIGESISDKWGYTMAAPFAFLSIIPRVYDEKIRERFYKWRIKQKQREIDMIDLGTNFDKTFVEKMLRI